jgi:hypothetical protein
MSRSSFQPVLILPGWFVKRTTGTGVPVFNANEVAEFVDQRREPDQTQQQVGRLCHPLDRRCRTVESKVGPPIS